MTVDYYTYYKDKDKIEAFPNNMSNKFPQIIINIRI